MCSQELVDLLALVTQVAILLQHLVVVGVVAPDGRNAVVEGGEARMVEGVNYEVIALSDFGLGYLG